jgi:hypothetical protein
MLKVALGPCCGPSEMAFVFPGHAIDAAARRHVLDALNRFRSPSVQSRAGHLRTAMPT